MLLQTWNHEIRKQTVPAWNNCRVSVSELPWFSRFLPFRAGGSREVWSSLISVSLLKCDKIVTLKCSPLKMRKENSSFITFIWKPRTGREDMSYWGGGILGLWIHSNANTKTDGSFSAFFLLESDCSSHL